ncbi:FecR family protein [Mucilaginibacter roseus]|uniref:FecR family protein n=1 Tax=Mucilaginibacter roseus TaxID=1528868 RepID=A0ABS8U411_9SPHI|nr:FecR family protein [Mucilaginibacter roseus]MCD8741027.1 FecR family protein [Mucilaginibacter roseus]
MHSTDELIRKYFNRQCTAEEAELVYRHLQQHPEIVERLLSEQDWKQFDGGKHPNPHKSAQMLDAILSQIDHQPVTEKRPLRLWRYAGVAASLILITGLAIFQLTRPEQVSKQYVWVPARIVNWQNTTNHGNGIQHILLDDGSDVALYPGSSVKYKLPFKDSTRDIYLTGLARFKVAKDKKRPFTVFSGEVATTALGTVFTITAWPADQTTKVKLHSGKVRVINTHNKFKPQYLLPGKQLVFNKYTGSISLKRFDEKPVISKPSEVKGAVKISGDTLRFMNQPLPSVFNKLQELYGTAITIEGDLKKYRFTGDFNMASDSLPSVLSTIGTLNQLSISKADSAYIITPLNRKKKK